MNKYLLLTTGALLLIIAQGCTNFGKEKDFNGVQLYHTSAITDAQADSLGKFLVDQKFADGSAKSVQITKAGNTYQFRFVVKEGLENDKETIKSINAFANSLSVGVFGHAPVEIDMCDKYLKTKRAFPFVDFGDLNIVEATQLYHTKDITSTEVNSLGDYLVKAKFANGVPKTVQLTKSGSTYQFRFVIKDGMDKDSAYLQTVKVFAGELSQNVFKGAPVEVHLCDDFLNTLVVIPMK
ncbi:MAG: hypothetical protein ACHQHN_00985 [Sphingobacteriales bacterium]